jgi:DNA-binding response OmpR family regulator
MKTILIIEDDAPVARGIAEALTAEHFDVVTAGTGERGLLMARRESVQLIILDLMLPDINGEDVCRQIRQAGMATPIMMLTSKREEMDKVMGLELGADDYMTKPFSLRELMARVRALLRRQAPLRKGIDASAFGDVEVDFEKQEVRKRGREVRLSAREINVLRYLIEHERTVVTREMLLNEVWGYEQFPTTRTVDNYVLSLRKKLEDDPAHPRHIITIPTAGYKFTK